MWVALNSLHLLLHGSWQKTNFTIRQWRDEKNTVKESVQVHVIVHSVKFLTDL